MSNLYCWLVAAIIAILSLSLMTAIGVGLILILIFFPLVALGFMFICLIGIYTFLIKDYILQRCKRF